MNTNSTILNIFITSPLFTQIDDAINAKGKFLTNDGIKTKRSLNEEELLEEIKKNKSSLVKAIPTKDGLFRSKFINRHLTSEGYIKKSDYGKVFDVLLCGEKISYCLVEDVNFRHLDFNKANAK